MGEISELYMGSIPACAGEPRDGVGGRYRDQVYPRVCGGTSAAALLAPVN